MERQHACAYAGLKERTHGIDEEADQAAGAAANQIKPLVYIGKNDLSETAVNQADETIEKRELIKVQVQDGSGLDSHEAADMLAERLGAEVVQVIGNRCVLYRRSKRDDVEHIRLVRE